MLFSIFLQYSTETKRSPVPLPNQKTLQVKVAKNSWKTIAAIWLCLPQMPFPMTDTQMQPWFRGSIPFSWGIWLCDIILTYLDYPQGWSNHLINTGWWYTYSSEKYEFVSWDDEFPNLWKNKTCSKPPTRNNQIIEWNFYRHTVDGREILHHL